jgi:ribosomal protein S18 acetylase RimI-like enzyme
MGEDGPLLVVRGIPDLLQDQVGSILWEAFSQKFSRVLRTQVEGQPLLAGMLKPSGCVLALSAARVLGVMIVSDRSGRSSQPSLRRFMRTYGPLNGAVRLALLSLLETRPPPGALSVDALAVLSEARGQGVGTLLLSEAEAIGRERGHSDIVLEVISENPNARRLYERCGFTLQRTESTPYLRSLFGFSGYHRMLKHLTAT